MFTALIDAYFYEALGSIKKTWYTTLVQHLPFPHIPPSLSLFSYYTISTCSNTSLSYNTCDLNHVNTPSFHSYLTHIHCTYGTFLYTWNTITYYEYIIIYTITITSTYNCLTLILCQIRGVSLCEKQACSQPTHPPITLYVLSSHTI